MSLYDTVRSGIDETLRLLDDPDLAPDPDRVSWHGAHDAVIRVRERLEQAVLAPLADRPLAAGEELAAQAADLTGAVAALVHASGDSAAARRLFERAGSLAPSPHQRAGFAAALREPTTFTLLAHAHWLEERGRVGEADERRRRVIAMTSQPALRDAAEGRSPAAPPPPASRPVRSAPPLFTLNGCGVRLYGARDRQADGSHIATYFVTIFFLPVLPLGAYRVFQDGNRYGFLSREPLSHLAVWWRRAALAAVVLAVVAGGLRSHFDTPARRARAAITAAARDEASLPPAAALARWQAVVAEWRGKVDPQVLAPAAAAVTRLAVAQVHEPFTLAQMDEARRALARVQELPEPLRGGEAGLLLERAVFGWCDQLTTGDRAHQRAALLLLDEAERVRGSVALRDRRRALGRALAASYERDEPLAALLLWIAEDDAEGRAAAVRLLAPIAGDGDLLLDIETDLAPWLDRVGSSLPDSQEVASTARAALNEARARRDDPGRVALLAGDEAGLRAALAAAPHDQQLVVALAQHLAAGGDAPGARKLLEALGPPGRMTAATRTALASILRDAGELDAAAALVAPLLEWRLPPLQSAMARLESADRAAREDLQGRLEAGQFDAELEPALAEKSEDEQRKLLSAWFEDHVAAYPAVVAARAELLAWIDVIPASLLLGQIELERARRVTGEARAQRLAAAEQAFLGIAAAGAGDPAYHTGLARVYFRLERPDDAERELASVLRGGEPGAMLSVAEVYKEQGMHVRAREVAEKVWADGSVPAEVRSAAAQFRAIVYIDEADEERWLERAGTEAARRNLKDIDARRQLRAGHEREADALFAEIAAAWEADAARGDVAGYNNAALAHDARYRCTGDEKHLDRGIALMERAAREAPDEVVVLRNLAELHEHRAYLRVVGARLPVGALRPDADAAESLFDWLAGSAEGGEAMRAALRADRSYRRALELLRRVEVLAPRAPGAYLTEKTLLARAGDLAGLAALAERVEAAGGFDLADVLDGRERARRGDFDAELRAREEAELRRLHRLVDAPPPRTPTTTLAAAWFLISRHEMMMAFVGLDGEAAGRARAALAEGRRLAPELARESAGAWSELVAALVIEVTRDPALAARWRAVVTRYGYSAGTLLLVRAGEAPALAAELRRQANAAGWLAALAKAPRLDVDDWLLATLLDDRALADKAAAQFTREDLALSCRIERRVYAELPEERFQCDILAAGALPDPLPPLPPLR